MGQLIIFEGLDGSGKGTQTKLTAQRLQQQGYDLRQITFPYIGGCPHGTLYGRGSYGKGRPRQGLQAGQ